LSTTRRSSENQQAAERHVADLLLELHVCLLRRDDETIPVSASVSIDERYGERSISANGRHTMSTYSAIEAAQLVGVGYSTIRAHVRNGRLRATRSGRSLRITERELRRVYPDAFYARDSANDSAHTATSSADTERAVSAMDGANDSAISSAHAAHTAELDVYRIKLEASEQAHEATRREMEALRDTFQQAQQQLGTTQEQLTDALSSIQALSAETQALTAMLHARPALPSPTGWLRNVVRQLVTFRV